MKHYKRLGIFKNSTGSLTYNPLTFESRSYSWFTLSLKIGRYNVINSYNYSNATVKHRHKLCRHLTTTFTRIDFFIEAPNGLNDLSSAERLYKGRIEKLLDDTKRKGTHKKKNAERLKKIDYWQHQLDVVYMLQEEKYRDSFEVKFFEDMDNLVSE